MYTWNIPRRKCVTPQRSLEFKIKYHLNREKRGYRSLRGESVIFRTSRKIDVRCDSL